MRIENNTLITGYCKYPLSEIKKVREPDNRPAKIETTGQTKDRWSIPIKVSNRFARNHKLKVCGNGYVNTMPTESEIEVRECWNAINEYKTKLNLRAQ